MAELGTGLPFILVLHRCRSRGTLDTGHNFLTNSTSMQAIPSHYMGWFSVSCSATFSFAVVRCAHSLMKDSLKCCDYRLKDL